MQTLTTLLLCLVSIFAAAADVTAAPSTDANPASALILDSSPNAIVLGFNASALETESFEKDGSAFQLQQIPGEGTTYENGKPQLPAVSRFVVVPPDAGLDFTYTTDEPRRVKADAPPFLCEDSLLARWDGAPLRCIYPGKLAEMSEPFVIRGVRLVKVTVYPVQYDPTIESYLYYDDIQTSIKFTGDSPVNPVTNPIRRYRSRSFLKAIKGLAINGDEVGRDDPAESESPYVGHYLVVAHTASLPGAREWIEFRRKTGYKMDIYSVPAGDAENANTIKRGIQNRYDAYLDAGFDPFDMIVLVGDQHYADIGNFPTSNVLNSFEGASLWAAFPHADYLFACLEGGNNDQHPDVGYARLPAGDQAMAGLVMGRTMAYEATPRMENPEWFTRGVVASQHWGRFQESAWHITIASNVRWGEEVLKSKGFEDIRFYEDYEYDQYGERVCAFINDAYNDGTNVMIERVENYWWYFRGGFAGVQDNTVFPIEITYSGHGEWAQLSGFRDGSADHLKGPVVRTCCMGLTATAPLNYLWLAMVNNIFLRDLPIGWARAVSINAVEGVFPDFEGENSTHLYETLKTDAVCWGDPGLQPWIGVPRLAEIDLPETISPNSRSLEVFVHAPDSQDPMPGAQVTFYAPGSMPQRTADYAVYTDFLLKTTTADADGIARFVLEENEHLVDATPLYVSASGRDVRPFTAQSNIGATPASLEVSNWTLSQREGNGDDVVNGSESFNLTLTVRNDGNRDDLADVQAHVESLTPYLEIIGSASTSFGDLVSGAEAEANSSVVIRFRADVPDAVSRPDSRPILKVDLTSGEQTWNSALRFDPVAPNLELASVVGGSVIPDSVTDLNLEITNTGSGESPRMTVDLISSGDGVSVVDGVTTLEPLASGQTARIESPFEVSGSTNAVPGSETKLLLIFTSDAGFADSAWFDLQVMTERAQAPTGPDDYGYICFDDTDTEWVLAPVYEWVEIDPNANNPDVEGTALDSIGGSPEDAGKCQVLDLGFTTQFYGREYSQITVAMNGFIAMGSQPRITNLQNWAMDEAVGGGVGMIAPYWDNLRYDENSGIYFYPDTVNGRFIVEWSRVHSCVEREGNEFTFEVILQDHSVWITETGDQNILIQYRTITPTPNIRNGDSEWWTSIPYGSVGISSPEGTTGLNYYFLNVQPTSAAPLQNRRALLFSTGTEYRSCVLYGRVLDARTGAPIENALVFTEQGLFDDADADGYWRIGDAIADIPFTLTARIRGYNDSVFVDQSVSEGDSAEFNFGLLHPEFTPSVEDFSATLESNQTQEFPFSIFNGGNGSLMWSAQKRLPGGANADPWVIRQTYAVGTATDDDRIEGVAFGNNHFYFCGANRVDSSLIYVVDRNLAVVDSFEQPTHTRYGMKDLEWDGQLLWGSGDTAVYGFTTNGEVVHSWRCPFNPTNNIAYDSDQGRLWMAGATSNFVSCDVDGNVLENLDRKGFRTYGLAYWPEDPDGYCLYILDSPGQGNPPRVCKMNTATGDTMEAYQLTFADGATGMGGLAITGEYDVYSWVLLTTQNISAADGNDRLDIYQLEARKDWFNLDVWAGVLPPEQTQEFTLTLSTVGLADTLFDGELDFTHNAAGGIASLDVSLRVFGQVPPDPATLLSPANGDTITALPQHGDSIYIAPIRFIWSPSHDPNASDSLISYVLHLGSGEQTVSMSLSDTTSLINFDTLDLPISFDAPINWWVDAISGQDTVESFDRFVLKVIPDAVDRKSPEQVVEFGLTSIYPAPFNSVTTIRFGADRNGKLSLRAYDVLGRQTTVLFEGEVKTGYYKVKWDAGELASGVYMLKLESAGRASMRKIALLR